VTSLPPAEELTTQRLVLEPLRVEHAAEMALTLDDVRLHEFTGGEPATRAELSSRYRRQVVGRSSDGKQQWLNWVLRRRDDGRAAGYVQATVEHDSADGEPGLVAELAWVVAAGHQRQGLAREAATAITRWLAGQGVQRLVAHVHPDNTASAAIARSLGMAPTEVVVDGEVRWTGPAQSSGSRSAISAAS
jgi:RimJ/RimL family protein N-acetyltransferase